MAAVAAGNESELQSAAAVEPPLTTAAAAADARALATLDPQLLMAARRGNSKALKDLLQLDDDDQQGEDTHGRINDEGSGTPQPTTAAAASTTTSVAVAPSISPPHVIVEVDPRRLDAVAAHLPPPPQPVPVPVLDEDGVTTEEGSLLVHSEEIVEQVVVEPPPRPHDDDAAPPPARQPPAAAPAVILDEDGVTMEGDSLLHVVAACGDTQEFLDCVDVVVRNKEKKSGAGAGGTAKRRALLEARNNKGDTPLHCAAGAGNAHMITRLVDLMANTADDDEATTVAAAKLAFLRMQNECGETALHQAIRAAAANHKLINEVACWACIEELMAMDPELACIPHEDGASPLYLAISLGEVGIAQHLYVQSKGKLSYSGPDGRNVLHAAVYFDRGNKSYIH